MKYASRLNAKGDTIVEVLIAMVVASMVLAGAYTATNRSLAYERDSQERSEALQLAQSQLEALRIKTTFNDALHDCFNDAGNPQTSANCVFNSDNSVCATPPATYCYTANLTYNAPSRIYTSQVTWPNVSGGKGKVELFYKTVQ